MKHFSEAGPARSFWNNNVSEDLLLRPHMSRGELLTNRRCVDVDCVEPQKKSLSGASSSFCFSIIVLTKLFASQV